MCFCGGAHQLYCSYEALVGLHKKSCHYDCSSANCEFLDFLMVISVYLWIKQMRHYVLIKKGAGWWILFPNDELFLYTQNTELVFLEKIFYSK